MTACVCVSVDSVIFQHPTLWGKHSSQGQQIYDSAKIIWWHSLLLWGYHDVSWMSCIQHMWWPWIWQIEVVLAGKTLKMTHILQKCKFLKFTTWRSNRGLLLFRLISVWTIANPKLLKFHTEFIQFIRQECFKLKIDTNSNASHATV